MIRRSGVTEVEALDTAGRLITVRIVHYGRYVIIVLILRLLLKSERDQERTSQKEACRDENSKMSWTLCSATISSIPKHTATSGFLGNATQLVGTMYGKSMLSIKGNTT